MLACPLLPSQVGSNPSGGGIDAVVPRLVRQGDSPLVLRVGVALVTINDQDASQSAPELTPDQVSRLRWAGPISQPLLPTVLH